MKTVRMLPSLLRNTYSVGLLTVLATKLAAAPYIYTEMQFPGAVKTSCRFVSGTNLVGYYIDLSSNLYGFTYNAAAWTSLTNPIAGSGTVSGTSPQCISDTNIVGSYWEPNGNQHGFLLASTNWITLDYPGAAPGPNTGTFASGMSGSSIVGQYGDYNGVYHGFLYNVASSNWTTLDCPFAGSNPGEGTFPSGISGNEIAGGYYDSSGTPHGFLYGTNQWTTVNDPAGSEGSWVSGISGTNIAGNYLDRVGTHSFIHSGTNWVSLDDPNAPTNYYPNGGTFVRGIEGTTVVGDWYAKNNAIHNAFLATPIPSLALTPSTNGSKISWPYSPFVNWIFQQSPDLKHWTTNSAAVSNDGTNNAITIGRSPSGNMFFRLVQ